MDIEMGTDTVQPGTSDSSASQQPKVINVFISLMLIVQKQESLFLQQRMHHLFLIILGGHWNKY